jgi:hypothetical protein
MIISAIKTQVKTDMSLLGEMILEPFQAWVTVHVIHELQRDRGCISVTFRNQITTFRACLYV